MIYDVNYFTLNTLKQISILMQLAKNKHNHWAYMNHQTSNRRAPIALREQQKNHLLDTLRRSRDQGVKHHETPTVTTFAHFYTQTRPIAMQC